MSGIAAAEIGPEVAPAVGRAWTHRLLKAGLLALLGAAGLYVVWGLYIAGEPILAALVFGTVAAIVILFGWARFYSWRFVFPGVAAVAPDGALIDGHARSLLHFSTAVRIHVAARARLGSSSVAPAGRHARLPSLACGPSHGSPTLAM